MTVEVSHRSPPVDGPCVPPVPEDHTSENQISSFRDETIIFVYISVKDSGPGLKPEDLNLLFQRWGTPLKQVDVANCLHLFHSKGSNKAPLVECDIRWIITNCLEQNSHNVFGGSGLGLFVSRKLCDLLGGRIDVSATSSLFKHGFHILVPRLTASMVMEPLFGSLLKPFPSLMRKLLQ